MAPICFIIQPFDGNELDRRYRETFKPALEKAGLDVYRVDLDPSADVLIDRIEDKIRDSAICFADISSHNPNVWYEVGFAFACGKRVVMTCTDGGTGIGFPFDVRHRQIITYKTDSEGLETLGKKITEKALAFVELGEKDQRDQQGARGHPPVRLNDVELGMFRLLVEQKFDCGTPLPLDELDAYGRECGLKPLEVTLARQTLEDGKLIHVGCYLDDPCGVAEEAVHAVWVTDDGLRWVSRNRSLFGLADSGPTKED